MSYLLSELRRGIVSQNPLFVLALGLCPALAVSTSLQNGLGMGLATTFVLIGSNLMISLLRGSIPERVRLPCYIVVIATFVSIVELLLEAYLPLLERQLGIYVPLIVVNCIVLGRAEAFASLNKPLPSLLDGLVTGLGFTLALSLLAAVRELFGANRLAGMLVVPGFEPLTLLLLAPGGFFTMALVMGLLKQVEVAPMNAIDFALLLQLALAAVFVNNLVLSMFLGLCPFFGVSRRMDSAVGMGLAVTFVMTVATLGTWCVHHLLLAPLGLLYLRTIVFVLVIAGLVQFVELVLRRYAPQLHQSMGIYLPLITTNCAVLGVAVLCTQTNSLTGAPYTLVEALVSSAASGAGFTLALLLMAGVRERLELAEVPRSLQGLPIAFIAAGLMALAFLGFAGFGK